MELFKRTQISILLTVLAILAMGGIFRLTSLNALPIFADESIYVRWSQVMKAESTLRFLPLSDGKQPLFMWAVIPFLKIYSDPLLAARMVSALCGLVTIVGLFAAGNIAFGSKKVGFIAAIIWAVVPYAVFFERLALADAMLAMFFVWSFNFMYMSLRYSRLDLGMFSGFCLGFAWLTKSPGMVGFALLPLLIFARERNSYSAQYIFKSLGILIVAFAIAFCMYNILRLGPEFYMIAQRNKDYVLPLSEVMKHPFDPLIGNLKTAIGYFWNLITPIGILFVFAGLFDIRKSHKQARFLIAIFFLLPIFIQSGIAKTFTARYLLYTVPFACLLAAHAIAHLGQHTKKHFLSIIGLLAIVLPSIWMNYYLLTNPEHVPLPRTERSGYLEEWTSGYGLKDISEQVIAQAQNSSVVVGSEGFFGTPFSALQMYTNKYPNIRIVGVGVYIESVSDNLKNALKDNKVYLVVNSSRFHISNPEEVGLRLLSSYPKAIRPDGTREYTLFFEVTK